MNTSLLPGRRTTLSLLAAFALVTLAGCAAWRINDARELARASQPFQTAPLDATGSLLVVGDSTAVGTGASSPEGSLAGLIARDHPGLRIVNRAVDGAKFDAIPAQLAADSNRFDVILVLAGGNDVIRLTREDKLREAIQQTAVLARARSNNVVFMPSGNAGNAPFFFAPVSWLMTERSQTLHRLVREAAATHSASYVNLYKPAADDPFAQRPQELHAADGLHPSDAGYRIWYGELNQQAQLAQKIAASKAATGGVARTR